MEEMQLKRKVLLASVIAILLMMSVFTGCKKQITEFQLQEGFSLAIDAVAATVDDPTGLIKEFEERSAFTLQSYEETDGGVIATYLVNAPDMTEIAKRAENGEFEDVEALKAAVLAELETAGTVETEVTVEFEKNGPLYTPVLTEAFLNAYFGGAFDAVAEKYGISLG